LRRIRNARRRFDLAEVATNGKRKAAPDGWRLNGRKTAVLDGNAAGQIIVLGAPCRR